MAIIVRGNMTEVNIIEEEKGDVFVLKVEGRLDATSSPVTEKRIFDFIDAGKHKIVLDLEKVDYLSSAGMRLLLATTKKLKALDGQMVVCALSDMVMDVIEMAGFDHILNIQDDEKQAIGQFQS